MEFEKTALTSNDHYDLLIKRGLYINDKDRFLEYLNHISYFRLTGYMYPFQSKDGEHNFKSDTTFENVLNHYLFDKKLRFLILEVIERIEISIRSKVANTMAFEHGTHWYLNSDLFINKNLHSEMVEKITEYCQNSNELFIKRYVTKYRQPSLPPVWMIMETFTFGQISSLFENLKGGTPKSTISNSYNIVPPLFESWLKSLNFVRNCCAHHSRLWNRKLPLKPKLPTRKGKQILIYQNEDTNLRIYGVLSCILHLLKSINPDSRFKDRVKLLFDEYPNVYIGYMGFSENWKKEPLWK